MSPLIVFSHLRWDFVYQRPQHVLSRIAAHRRVYFVEEPVHDAAVEAGAPAFAERQHPAPGVTVVRAHTALQEGGFTDGQLDAMRPVVRALSRDVGPADVWFYTPLALPLLHAVDACVVVYDCMDELAAFDHAPAELLDREQELLERTDLVFAGGPSLYRAKKDRHPSVHQFTSSVDADHFGQATAGGGLAEPDDQAGLPRPRLGFFGVVDERLDRDLVGALAAAHPEWHLVMVGPVVKIDPESLPQAPNLHWLGPKAYADLPAYLAGWDVCLLPFARNRSTEFISPTKTLEYMAAERPIVSTLITDVAEPYGDIVYLADTAEAFVAACEAALAESEVEKQARVAAMRAVLAETSWDRTADAMRALLVEAAERTAEPAAAAPKDAAPATARPSHSRHSRRNTPLPYIDASLSHLPARPVYDTLIVGAGFAGSVLAERLATELGQRVLIVDKRPHIAGNAYDHYNDDGLLVHKYGPHIFHTNAKRVFDYLSRFTQWRPYEHRVLASVDGQLVPIPINLDTINKLYGLTLTSFEVEAFFASVAEPRSPIRTSEDVVVSTVGQELYRKFFRNYTRKQWGLDPSELDASVTARVPTRTNRDDRYFTDQYQAMPLHGYTRMFERMLDHPNIHVMLNVDYREIRDLIPHTSLVYTGPVDEYFDFRFGKLPYRSLEFKHETHSRETFQPAPVVNFPNEHAYTRCTEFKYLTGQEHPSTAVVYEYPQAEGDPYYPIPRPENAELYRQYQALAEAEPDVHFVGRLATYKYYNMDQVVAQALTLFDEIAARGAEVVAAPRPTGVRKASIPTAPRAAARTTAAPATEDVAESGDGSSRLPEA